jgi:hypothetical protein
MDSADRKADAARGLDGQPLFSITDAFRRSRGLSMNGFLLVTALQLHLLHPAPSRAFSIERSVDSVFSSDAEATNFGAHVGWSLALPFTGYAVADRRGLYAAGGAWLTYSLLNEFVMHGPESAHERELDLMSRLVPCAAVMIWTAVRNNHPALPVREAVNP